MPHHPLTFRRRSIGNLPVSIGAVITCLLIGIDVCFAEQPESSKPLEADEVAQLEPDKLKQLLETAQDQIEVSQNLDGVLLTEIRMGRPDARRERTAVLEGRIREPQQRPLIIKVVRQVMQSDSFWNTSDDEFVVDPDKLSTIKPSAELSSKNFSLGIESLGRNKFAEADQYFTKALVESRDSDRAAINFCKAATDIAMGRADRAERRVTVLLQTYTQGSDALAKKLEKLQLSRRKALIELEQKVLLKSRLGTGVK